MANPAHTDLRAAVEMHEMLFVKPIGKRNATTVAHGRANGNATWRIALAIDEETEALRQPGSSARRPRPSGGSYTSATTRTKRRLPSLRGPISPLNQIAGDFRARYGHSLPAETAA